MGICPVHLFNQKHEGPSYLIVAGLVFTALSVPFLRSEFGEEWDCEAPAELVHRVAYQRAEAQGEQLVVLTQLLAHDLTVGYEDLENILLETINGVRVQNLKHVKELTEDCRSGYLRLGLQANLTLVLKAEAINNATEEVLKHHNITAAMSPDLAGLPAEDASDAVGRAAAAAAVGM